MANLGIDVGTDVKLGADSLTLNGETAYRQLVALGGYTTLGDGRKVVAAAGTRETLGAATIRKVFITAETDNTGIVVVGGASVVAALATRRGLPLSAGDTVEIDVTELANVYLDVTVSGDGVTYFWLL